MALEWRFSSGVMVSHMCYDQMKLPARCRPFPWIGYTVNGDMYPGRRVLAALLIISFRSCYDDVMVSDVISIWNYSAVSMTSAISLYFLYWRIGIYGHLEKDH